MALKKNNHILPRCVINQWIVDEKGKPGVYVYDNEKARIYFSTAEKKRAFSFAIEHYFYVPESGNEKIYKVEDWLASIEDTLARFIDKINHRAEGELLRDPLEYTKLLLALFSLKNRDKYNLSKIKDFLAKNPDKKKLVQMKDERDIGIATLENLINLTTEEAIEYKNAELNICRNKAGNLILGDRYFLNNLFDGYSFVVLSPYFFIAIRKTTEAPLYSYNDVLGDMAHTCNLMIAEQSRYWMVSGTKENLELYIPEFLKPKDDPEPIYQEVKFLRNGYNIM